MKGSGFFFVEMTDQEIPIQLSGVSQSKGKLPMLKGEVNKEFRERSDMVKIKGYEIKLCSRYDRARQLGSKKRLTPPTVPWCFPRNVTKE